MISKELFIQTCELIKKKRQHTEALCEALELCSPQEQINAFIYSEYEELVVKLLHVALELEKENDILDWWIWDREMGKDFTLGDYTIRGKEIDLSTPEKFYDYITKGRNIL